MRKTIITLSLMAFLAACGTNPAQPPVTTVKQPAINQKPPITAPKASAFLELEVSGLGTELTPTATARIIKPGNLNAQAVTVQPVTGGSSLDDVQFTKNSVSFYDDSASSTRYVVATFNITNRFNFAWDNLTLYAVNTSSATGGTAVAGMWDASNTLLTDETKYRALLPAHGMMTGAGGVPAVNQNIADLQWFMPEEAYSVKTQAVTQSIIPNGSSVLQYGFVARNLSNGRGIAARNTSTNCTINDCKGTVTFAYSFPIGASNNPQRFRTQFVIGNETSSQISQSTQEQTANKVAGLGDVSSFGQARVLTGSTFAGTNKKPFGSIQTAIGTTSNPLAKLFPTPVSGGFDAGFGTSGVVTTAIGTANEVINAVALQPDGKIVAAGYSGNGTNDDFAVVRYNTDGSLDTSFDTDGKVTTGFGAANTDIANAIAIQTDGKIVVAGYSFYTDLVFAIVRYNTDGSLDTNFDTDGKVTTQIGSDGSFAKSVIIQSDGKIVAAGDAGSLFALSRYNVNGSLDTTFDTDGKVTTAVGNRSLDSIKAMTLQSDGKILVTGSAGVRILTRECPVCPPTAEDFTDFAVARLNTNGSLDTSFDTDGKVTTRLLTGSTLEGAKAITLQSDGKIVVAGTSSNGGVDSFAVFRYATNGSLDTTFDGDGQLTTDTGFQQRATAISIQPNGKIVVAGTAYQYFSVVRYNSSGSLDTTFNTTGKLLMTITDKVLAVNAMILQPDSKIVLAGSISPRFNANYDFGLFRINP
jgi:uncharacterized delta-60 repeat protein